MVYERLEIVRRLPANQDPNIQKGIELAEKTFKEFIEAQELTTPDGTHHTPVFTEDGVALYSALVVANYADVSKSLIDKLAKNGRIKAVKVGSAGWMVSPGDLLRYRKTAGPGGRPRKNRG